MILPKATSPSPVLLTVSPPTPHSLDETYEIYDQSTLTTPRLPQQRQRQQRRSSVRPNSAYTLDTPAQDINLSVHPTDTRRYSENDPRREQARSSRPRHTTALESIDQRLASERLGVGTGARNLQHRFSTHRPLQDNPSGVTQELSEEEENPSTLGDPGRPDSGSYWPTRTNRVSSRTASAVLWALEEAIRQPISFTADFSELNASMSELVGGESGGGRIPAGHAGNGRAHYNGVPRGTQAPAPTGTHPHSGVRTPTDIMRQRRDREARKRAEQEAKEREQQELEQINKQAQEQLQSQRFSQSGRSQQAAGVTGEASRRPGMGTSRPPDVALPQDPGIKHDRTTNVSGPQRYSSGAAGRGGGMASAADHPTAGGRRQELRPESHGASRDPQQEQHGRQQRASVAQPRVSVTSAQTAPQEAGTSQPRKTQPQPSSNQQGQSQQQQQNTRSRPAFPHAFERWEMLSSHWEGLTSYWIRRLEQNNEELSREPLNQQMSRQITDLSAAGANLFHAVVELQRLRASSERKFQRWFFDTRAEQERFQEVHGELERSLKTERQNCAEAISAVKQAESDKAKAEELAREMRRELQISRDEARRAWEELGRREQEERDRTASLRSGEPTIVGGVQVVPMLQSTPSRQISSTDRPPAREGPYPGGPDAATMGGQRRTDQMEASEQYAYDSQVSSPTATDPFTETNREPAPFHYVSNSQGYEPPSSRQHPSTTRPSGMQGQGVPSSSGYSQASTRGEEARNQFYQHESLPLHGEPGHPAEAEGTESIISEDPDAPLTSRPDLQGRQLVYPRAISVDSDDYPSDPLEAVGSYDPNHGETGYRREPSISDSEDLNSGYGQDVDYSGEGWGPGWDSVTPRHRHPTRLSDVIEEDERSRTSPSRASQASRSRI